MTDQLDWETSPIWLWGNGSAPIRSTQHGTDRVDVLVVGAGLAGTATAYYLAANRPDLRVMVVEASQVGLGATGRSTGIIGPGLGMPMRSLRRRYGDAVAAEAFASTLNGTVEIGRLISAEGIECDARVEHQVIGALTARQERRMRGHTRDLDELGFPVRWRDRRALDHELGGAYRAAFAYENVLLVDPYQLVTGLAVAAERRGVRIAERTRVTRLETRPSGVRAHTPGGVIEADQVLLAVDGYGEDLNPHPSSVVPVRTHVVATAPLTAAQRAALSWDGIGGVIDQRNFFSYYRLGAGGRLVFGGGPARLPSGDPRRQTRASAAVFDRVVEELHRRFPALCDVAIDARWSGLTGGTLDRLPVVGPVGDNPRVHFAGGWCGHGLSLCVSTARRYAMVLADGRTPASDETLPWFRGRAIGLPAPLRAAALPAYLRALDVQDRIAGRVPASTPPAAVPLARRSTTQPRHIPCRSKEEIVRPDYLEIMVSESRELASLLETLSAQQWEAPSLCAGWRVKDVVAHMAVGHTMPLLGFGAAVAGHRFRISAASYSLATAYADAHPVEEILARFRAGTSGRPRAAARFVPIRELFTDHLVHHQDIRRPLGMSRMIPPDRLHAALTALPGLSGRVGSRRRMSGLRVVATDLDFELGRRGPELRGPAEALIMALTGRVAALGELSGSAVPTLARRLPAPRTRTGRRPASAH